MVIMKEYFNLIEKRMIVFGGYNEKGFLNAEVECLLLDSRAAVKINK